jgi:hypothetical protein
MRPTAKSLAAALGIVVLAGGVVAYAVTLPSAETHRAPVARVTTPPGAPEDVAAQAQAENSYDSGEKTFAIAARREHAKDAPVIDVCTGKPIKGGPTIDVTNKQTDCPPPTATKGAYEALDALDYECAASKPGTGPTKAASRYLLREARTRPTWDLFDVLLAASYTEMACDRRWDGLALAGKFLDAAERIMDTLRPTNRFLDGPNKRRQAKRERRLKLLQGRFN